jgi:hypothetical protein
MSFIKKLFFCCKIFLITIILNDHILLKLLKTSSWTVYMFLGFLSIMLNPEKLSSCLPFSLFCKDFLLVDDKFYNVDCRVTYNSQPIKVYLRLIKRRKVK